MVPILVVRTAQPRFEFGDSTAKAALADPGYEVHTEERKER
jgi:hypothetical protein